MFSTNHWLSNKNLLCLHIYIIYAARCQNVKLYVGYPGIFWLETITTSLQAAPRAGPWLSPLELQMKIREDFKITEKALSIDT